MNRRYYESLDILRLMMIVFLIMNSYMGLGTYNNYIKLLLNVAPCVLFTIYGYLVLRDDRDLMKDIKKVAKAFAIMFVIYLLISMGYTWLLFRKPFLWFTKRGIFNFVVLNYWGTSIGSSIWMLQSVLYALIFFYVFRKFKKYDMLVCILFFIIAILVGEGAGIIHFNVLGYNYIPGNFITRTIPYMLLGRYIHINRERLVIRRMWNYGLLLGGAVLCIGEYLGLALLKKLVYDIHMIGLIPMSFALVVIALSFYNGKKKRHELRLFGHMYKISYYIYNPIAELLILAVMLIPFKNEQEYYEMMSVIGIAILFLTLGIALLITQIINSKAKKKQKKEIQDETHL